MFLTRFLESNLFLEIKITERRATRILLYEEVQYVLCDPYRTLSRQLARANIYRQPFGEKSGVL